MKKDAKKKKQEKRKQMYGIVQHIYSQLGKDTPFQNVQLHVGLCQNKKIKVFSNIYFTGICTRLTSICNVYAQVLAVFKERFNNQNL